MRSALRERIRQSRAALAEHPRDPARAQQLQAPRTGGRGRLVGRSTRMTSTPCADERPLGSTGASTLVDDPGRDRRAALATSRASSGVRRWMSITMRTGERSSRPGSRTVEQRIVGQNRSDADHDRIRMRAHQVDPRVRGLAR